MTKLNIMLNATTDLIRLHRQARPLAGKGCSIKITRRDNYTMWLSGLPYLFTAYAERAFRFCNRKEAKEFITRHSEELKYKCRIHEWAA